MKKQLDFAGMIDRCQRIIRTPGESGSEGAVASYLKQVMEELGYDRVWIDEWGNAIGVIEGTGSQTILLEGHMDTVSVEHPAAWQFDPYGGVVQEGKLYGRGTTDMKAALMAMVCAAAALIPVKDRLPGRIVVAGVVHEEIFEGVAQGKVLDQVKPDFVIIGEASELKLCIGQRGRAEIQVKTFGKSAHSANPGVGVNAVKKMVALLQELEQIVLPEDDFLGSAILELTDIHSTPYPGKSVIPDQCVATFDRRLLPGETEESVLEPLRAAIGRLQSRDAEFQAEAVIVEAEAACYTGETLRGKRFFPAWRFAPDAEFVLKLQQALRANGQSGEISHYAFCTDGSQSAGIRQIPTVGFGPSRETLAHVVDEYIELEQLEGAYQGYIALIKGFFGE